MARPREFDETAVLRRGGPTLWVRGYEATSIRDLAESMDLSGASLYNAFGDKRALYRRALDHYIAGSFADRVRRLEGHFPPRETLRRFFDEIVERSLADKQRRGCMLINSALEVAPHDPAFRRAIAKTLAEVEAFFRRCAVAGQRDGTINTTQSAEDLARLLLSALAGIRLLVRARPERPLLEGIVRPIFALLDDTTGQRTSRS